MEKVWPWITKAVIWFLPVTLTVIGLMFLLGAEWRSSNPAYDVPKIIMPIPLWGVLFLGCGLFEWGAHLAKWQQGMIWSKVAGAGLCLVWALLLGGSLILHWGEAPVLFPLLFLGMAFYHMGVVTYLARTG